jgi:excisionase family DNA binding protein
MAVKSRGATWDPERSQPSAEDATLFTKREAANYLGVKLKRIEKLQRTIGYVKVGGSVRFHKDDLDAYIASRRVGPDGQ